MSLISNWKARVDAALGVLGAEKVMFATSLQERCADYAKFHDHTGQECTIVAAILEPSPSYDEESLPYYRVKFEDGVELEAGDEELFGKSEAFFGVLTAVSGAFAVARELDFVGPTHLAADGSDEVKGLFVERFAGYRVEECVQNFNTPEAYRTTRTTAEHSILEDGREQTITPQMAGVLQSKGLIYPQRRDARGFWHIADGKGWAEIDAVLNAFASRSAERVAIAGLIEMIEEMMLGGLTKEGLTQLVANKLAPARALLDAEDLQLARLQQVESALRDLIDDFDNGEIEGDSVSFEVAREVYQRTGKLCFGNWLGRVCSEMAVDEVEASSYREFYKQGLTPSEAVLQERLASGALEG